MRKMTDYPNTNTPTIDTPHGTFKNESEPNKADGTDIKAEQMQDLYYALYQILQLAGEVPNGELENGNNSKQFIKSLVNVGWFKYDGDIEYKKGSIVLNTVNHITKIYRSQKNNNTDILSNTESWINIITVNADNTITLNTTSTENTGVFMGAFMHGIRKDTPEGWLRCDGNEYPASAFTGFVNNYLLPEKIPYLSLENWQTEYNRNNGNCGYFGYRPETIDEYNLDENGNPIIIPAVIRTPCFKDQLYITTALNSGNIGKFTEAGLPNITGTYQSACSEISNVTGAFTGTHHVAGRGYWNGWDGQAYRIFNASNSNPIYGKSNTVTTDNVSYPIFICVSNSAVPVSESQYNGFLDGLNNKANINGSNVNFNSLSETAKNNIRNTLTPDYSTGISIASGYVCTYNCYAVFEGAHNGVAQVAFINGVSIGNLNANVYGNSNYAKYNAYTYCKPNDIITFTNGAMCRVFRLR